MGYLDDPAIPLMVVAGAADHSGTTQGSLEAIMRDININAVCAHCGELLDTNEVDYHEEVVDGVIDGVELHVGTQHECFQTDVLSGQLEHLSDDPEAEYDPRTVDEIVDVEPRTLGEHVEMLRKK